MKYPLAVIFDHWIANHPALWRHVPRLISRRRGVSRYSFCDVTKAITLSVCEDGQIMIQATYRGRCYDILIDFDLLPTCVQGGWVCGFCSERRRRVYRTQEWLYVEHSLKPLAAWVQENIRNGKVLVLELSAGGSTRATIADKTPKGARSVPVIGKK